uniref:(California timema) hypothetical protein n=1 Tax=Timema californicum TaxID=61474 RepID=A0A7R9J7V9_TIMCA|nr:unnamed protein product [Timema californicum]
MLQDIKAKRDWHQITERLKARVGTLRTEGGQTVELKTGDQFGLLQDSFWYRVLVPEPEPEITKNILEHNVLKAPADTPKDPHIPVENVADNPSCITVTNEPSDVVANGSSPVKRKLPAWMSKYQEKIDRNVSPKKIKTERNPTPSTSALKITNESVRTSASNESNANKKQRVQSKAHQMSQSGDEDTSMPAFDGHKVKKEQDVQSKLSRYVVVFGGKDTGSRVGDAHHWRVHSHSLVNTGLAASPTTDKRLKISLAVQGKPRKTHGKSSEEDDYDLNDSFLNDGSSDDYQPTDLDSDSDSVSDEVDEPDTKRMKKEAKKFVKK